MSKREMKVFVVIGALIIVFSSASQILAADSLFQVPTGELNPCARLKWSRGMPSRKTKEEALGQQQGTSPSPASVTAPTTIQQQHSAQQPNLFQVDGMPIDRRMEFHKRGLYAQQYWPSSIKELGFKTDDLPDLPRKWLVEFSQQNADSVVPKSLEQKSFPKELDPQIRQELERARKPHAKAVLLYAAGRIKHSTNACEDALSVYDSALSSLNSKPQNGTFDKFVKAENNKVVRLHELVLHLIQFQDFDESFLFSSSETPGNIPLTKKLTHGVARKFTVEEGVARYDVKTEPIVRMKKMAVYYWPKPLTEIGCTSLDLPILDDKNVDQLIGLNVEDVVVEKVDPKTRDRSVDAQTWKSLAYARTIYAKALILYMQEQFVPARRAARIAQRAYEHVHDEIVKGHRDESLSKFVEQEKQQFALCW